MGGAGNLPVRPCQDPRAGLLDRHPAADRQRLAARRATCSPTPTPTSSPATSGCAASRSSTRWAGTTTGCRPSAGSRTTSGSGATRRCPTTPTSCSRRSRTRSGRCRSPGATSSSSASTWTDQVEQAFETLWRTVGLSVDWSQKYTTIGEASITASQRAFLRNLARGEAYQHEAPSLWDVTFQTAVAQAELEARDYPGHYHRIAFHGADGAGARRDDPPRADPGVRGPDRPPGRRALPGHVRHDGALAAVRRRGPGGGPPRGRAGQGRRHRDVLHLRRPHRRAVVARAGPADPFGGRPRRPAAPGDPGVALPRAGLGGVRRARRQDHLLGARSGRRPAARVRRPRRRADAHDRGWRTSTRTATSRWRSSPAGSGTSATAAGTRRCGRPSSSAAAEITWVPDLHAAPLRELGRRAATATG